jgi:hypothetical protein
MLYSCKEISRKNLELGSTETVVVKNRKNIHLFSEKATHTEPVHRHESLSDAGALPGKTGKASAFSGQFQP